MTEFEAERQRLADAMEERGAWFERSEWIRQAVDALSRHRFAPDRLWDWDGHGYVLVDRAADPEGWAAMSTVLWDYGMTVERGRQYVWARDSESGPRWLLHEAEVRLAG